MAQQPSNHQGEQRRQHFWLEGNLLWLFAGRGVRSFSQAFLVVIVPLYVVQAGYSVQEFGFLLSVASLGSVVFTLAVGLLSDRYGRRRILLALAALSALGALAYALTTEFWILAAAGALASIGRGGGAGSGGAFGPFFPAEQALVAGSCRDEDRNAAFGIISFLGVLAGAAGSETAAIAALAHNQWHLPWLMAYRLLFWLAVATGIALVLLTLPIHEVGSGRRVSFKLSPATLKLLAKLWLANGLNGLVWGVLGPFLTYWFHARYGVGAASLGLLYTAANLAAALPYLGAASIARRMGSVLTVSITRSISVVFLIAMTLAPTFGLSAVAFVLRLIVGTIGNPVRQSYVMGISSEDERSTVAAFSNLPAQFTSTIAPSLASYLFEAVSIESPLFLAGGVQVLNAVIYLLLFRNIRPPEEIHQDVVAEAPSTTDARSASRELADAADARERRDEPDQISSSGS